jgi:hypothetical protein
MYLLRVAFFPKGVHKKCYRNQKQHYKKSARLSPESQGNT